MFKLLKDMLKSGGDVKEEKPTMSASTSGTTSSLAALPISGPEALIINEKLKELFHSIHEVEEKRQDSDDNIGKTSYFKVSMSLTNHQF